jgi:catechol 2,3-dioxygenase-like lactoylglutathione lyase family enzyme
MAVQLNHTIVAARDRDASAKFLADVLGLEPPVSYGPFMVVQTANGVSMDFAQADDVQPHHYAFLVDEDDFDAIFGRITERGLPSWADPHQHHPNAINHWNGGRGVYFPDPSGHYLEILTRPYGSGEDG